VIGNDKKLKTHKDLDAWKDLGLWTYDSGLQTGSPLLITDHLSPITDYGAVQREERKSKVKI